MPLISSPSMLMDYFKQTGDTCVPSHLVNQSKICWAVQLNINGQTYYTTKLVHAIEKEIARNVIKHREAKSVFPTPSWREIEEMIREYEKLEGERLNCVFKLAPEQAEAVHKAIKANFFVLTGGPGTGKTCVLKCIQYILKKIKPGCKIRFTAPTGKAARRITESTGEPAETVQKAMHLVSETASPNPIWCDCIIVDEISMLDTYTADAFFAAVVEGTKIILVGDVDQLPSVGFGSVLRDLIESSVLTCEGLRAPQRQKGDSTLFENITRCKNGQAVFQEGNDFFIIEADEGNEQKQLLDEYFKAVERWDGIDNVCMLTPYRRKGNTCANVLNDIIQSVLNPSNGTNSIDTSITEDIDEETANPTKRKIRFTVGDPVIQLVNRAEIANGDVGKVTAINLEKRTVTVKYDGDITVSYWERELSQLNLAYCISVHKSQGSEYKCVVTSAFKEHKQLLSRNMMYTAITRAKKECVFVMDTETVKTGIKVQAGYQRNTNLSKLISDEGRKADLLKSLAA